MKTVITALVEFAIAGILLFWLGCEKPQEPDNTPPTVIITNPADGAILTAPVTIRADATDNDAVKIVTFLVDGVVIGEDSSSPYEQYWNVSYWADGSTHTILAKATDKSGNVGQSDLVVVTVSKDAVTSPILVSPADDAVIAGTDQVTLVWRALPNATYYVLAVSSRPNFSDTEYSATVTDTNVITSALPQGLHYWHVRGQNALGLWSEWSTTWRFYLTNIYIFSKTFGGSGYEWGSSVQQTLDGGILSLEPLRAMYGSLRRTLMGMSSGTRSSVGVVVISAILSKRPQMVDISLLGIPPLTGRVPLISGLSRQTLMGFRNGPRPLVGVNGIWAISSNRLRTAGISSPGLPSLMAPEPMIYGLSRLIHKEIPVFR